MKLQKQLSRKIGNKEYNKWIVVIPSKHIDTLGWNEGEHLDGEINNQELIIRREDPEKAEKRSDTARKAWKTRKKGERK